MTEAMICEDAQVKNLVEEAAGKLKGADGRMALDFSAVHRLDAAGVRELANLAAMAEDKGVKVVLQGASIEVYRVLKLMKLAPRFTFVS